MSDSVVALHTPAALGGGLSGGPCDPALLLEASQRQVGRGLRDLFAGLRREVVRDLYAVSGITEPDDREQHQVLELAQEILPHPTPPNRKD